MIIVTTNEVPGYAIDAVLGEVMGMTVRAANFGANFSASFRAIGGGEVTEYTQLVYESRNEVMNRMWAEAERRGANAIVGMRFDTGDIGQAFTEICAYGTAVVARPLGRDEEGATPQSIQQSAATQSGPQPGTRQFGRPQPGPPQGQQPWQPQATGTSALNPPVPQQHSAAQQPVEHRAPGQQSATRQPPAQTQQPPAQTQQPPAQQSAPSQPGTSGPASQPMPAQQQPQPEQQHPQPEPQQSAQPMPRSDTHGYSPQIPPPQDRTTP